MNADAILRDLVAFSVQVTLVAGVASVSVAVLKVPPRARYAFLRLALFACLTMPWLIGAFGSVLETTARAEAADAAAVSAPFVTPTASMIAVPSIAPPAARRAPAFSWAVATLAVIALGVCLRALWLIAGMTRLRRLVRRSVSIESAAFLAIQQELGTSARIAQAAGLAQPVTFGCRRPVVLLPEALASAPAPLQRAVVTHELFHVRRGDWLSVIGEEVLRTVLWFHPAVFWLTSRIRVAREEIVDELSVRATGDRRTYIQALLAFADTPGLSAATPAFAQRRHLFHRIVTVSKENPMTVRRVVASVIAAVAVVFGTGWHAGAAFPVAAAAHLNVLAFGVGDHAGTQPVRAAEPRPPRPEISVATGEFRAVHQRAAQTGQSSSKPVSPENQITRDSWSEFVRETQDSLRVLAAETTGVAAVSLEDFLRARLATTKEQLSELEREQNAALAQVAPDHPDVAMLRQRVEQVRESMARLEAELRRAIETRPRPVYRGDAPGLTPPRPVQVVRASYTQAAMAARVEGTVVIEAIVDEQGLVAGPKVIRSLPLLDEAALATVRQWVFSPGLLNGEPVPVLVQIELEYHLR